MEQSIWDRILGFGSIEIIQIIGTGGTKDTFINIKTP
jgi:hypothetical protein